ncbi:MAG TPA: sensor domain-containing diguanylate cyclase [Candidatus Acidoferrum sp.]|nr:sensor domain-containing diguanylate cyclase [Candidatus Acidoferrum sp.]
MPLQLRTEHLLAAILSSSEDALLSFALDGTVQTWSPGAQRLYGYAESEIVGQQLARLLPARDAAAAERTVEHSFDGLLRAAISGHFPHHETSPRLHKDGSAILVRLTHVPIRDENGHLVAILETGAAAAAASPNAVELAGETHLKLLVDQMPMVVWTTDTDLRITSCLGARLRGAKMRNEELLGKSVYEYLKCQDPHTTPVVQHYDALRGVSSQFEYKRNNRTFELHLEPLRSHSGEIIGCIGAGLDITERKKNEEKVHYQATHDALTGLANYREFLDSLEREVRRGERSNRSFAVLLLDLDELKAINDRFGHLAGNRALKRLSEVMKEQCRATDLAARYGGDEFAVLLVDGDPGMARQIAGRIEQALGARREEPRLSVSIGISIFPDDGRSVQDLLEAADRELYQRKRGTRGRVAPARAR